MRQPPNVGDLVYYTYDWLSPGLHAQRFRVTSIHTTGFYVRETVPGSWLGGAWTRLDDPYWHVVESADCVEVPE